MSQQEEVYNNSTDPINAENAGHNEGQQKTNRSFIGNADLSQMDPGRKASIDATIESIATNTAINTSVKILGLGHAHDSVQKESPAVVNNQLYISKEEDGGNSQAAEQDISTIKQTIGTVSEPVEDIQAAKLEESQDNTDISIQNEHDGVNILSNINKDNFARLEEVSMEDSPVSQEIKIDVIEASVDDSAPHIQNKNSNHIVNNETISLTKEKENNDTNAFENDNHLISNQTDTDQLQTEEQILTVSDIIQHESTLSQQQLDIDTTKNSEDSNTFITNCESSQTKISSGSVDALKEENNSDIKHSEANMNEGIIDTENVAIAQSKENSLCATVQNSQLKDHNDEIKENLSGEVNQTQETLPWEKNQASNNQEDLLIEENKSSGSLPWDDNQSQNNQETLPWEENQASNQKNLIVEENQTSGILPLKDNQISDNEIVITAKEDAVHENLLENNQIANKIVSSEQSISSNIQEHATEKKLSWDDGQNVNTKQSLPWEESKDELLPWEENQNIENQERVEKTISSEDNKSEQLPWENKQPGADENLPCENRNKKEKDALKSVKNLDNLLDDNDFVESDVSEKKSNLESNEKSKSLDLDLDLDLDDDLLLDDEFLEDVPTISLVKTKPQPKKYVSNETKSNQFDLVSFENQKKKSDAYDFPSDLVNRPKPAVRTNKYSSGTGKTYSLPVQKPENNNSQGLNKPTAEINTKPLPIKPFFEELPIDLTKVTKPARAAPVKAMNQNSIVNNLPQANANSTNQPPPSNQNAPVNPYAKLTKPLPPNNSTTVIPAPLPQTNNLATPNTRHNSQYVPLPQVSPINTMANPHITPSQASAPHSGTTRNLSNTSPVVTNANLLKQHTSATSPYIPNTGPYAPSGRRTHVRSNSLIGGKGKEVNPYAPISTNPNVSITQNQNVIPPTINNLSNGITASNIPGPTPANNTTGPRKISNPRPGIYAKSHPVQKSIDPNIGFHKQFPIFTWSNSQNAVSLIPSVQVNTYHKQPGEIHVRNINNTIDTLPFSSFPGPLNKMSKKKDVEKWLESRVQYINNDNNINEMEIMMNHILLEMIKHNDDTNSKDLIKAICSILNPSVDYYSDEPSEVPNNSIMISNASKLDSAGINIVFNLIQVGKIDKALEYAISRGDWALSLVMSNIVGEERYSKIVSDYSRFSFPFQKSNNKVHHLMPILLKLFAGSVKSVIDDFNNVQTEKEWALSHWREIIAVTLIMESSKSLEFILEFGKLLAFNGNIDAATIAFVICRRPLSPIQSADNIQFSVIQMSMLYTELYEYILSIYPNSVHPPLGFPHLLPLKLKHASLLADYGNFSESQKYIDLVNSMIKNLNKSPYVNATLLHEFQNLIIRVSDTGSMDQGWFSGKISKVNLDKVWGQIDKFIGGDEPTTKANDGGVFSKFSPSISRTTSTLDFTASSSNFPPNSNIRRDSLPLSSDNQLPSYGRSKSFMAPYSTSLTGSKYSNQAKAAASSVQAQNNDIYPTLPISKYAHSNASSQSLPIKESFVKNDPDQKKYPTKYNPISCKDNDDTKGYTNLTNQNSGFTDFNQQPSYLMQAVAKRPSVTSVNSTDYTNMDAVRKLNHSPSIQSDVSIDFPTEFRAPTKRDTMPTSDTQPVHDNDSHRIGNINTATDIISEVEEKSDSYSNNTSNAVLQQDPKTQLWEEQMENTNPLLKPPAIPSVPPSKSSKRLNPYAPRTTSTLKQDNRKGKYGPSSSNRSKYSSQVSRPLTDEVPKLNITDKPHIENINQESNVLNPPSLPPHTNIKKKEENNSVKNERENRFQASFANTELGNNDFNKAENGIEESLDKIPISTPERRKSLFLKDNQSPTDPEKPSMFNPYNKPKKEVTSVLDTSFGEFSIPGSPEYTTRANSVIGGPSLFTSRLSESQQSALYQQYEVRDDTVRDYIPPVEEEEEEEEVEIVSVNTQEQANENNEQENNQGNDNKKTDAGKGSFFSWFSKNDGKPKPTRANLGEENMFYYSEEHKRYINKNIPIEDQIKETKPPPPPIAKKPLQTGAVPSGPSRPNIPPGPASNTPPTPVAPDQEKKGDQISQDSLPLPKPKGGPSLANAGLEDLLSLGGSSSSVGTARKSRRGARRGYVNVMEQN